MIKKEIITLMSEKEKLLFLKRFRETYYAAHDCCSFELDKDFEYFEKVGRPLYEKLKTIFS